jgi:hypothetical protein
MSISFKEIIRSKKFKIGLIVLVCLIVLGFALPQVLTLHYQSRAGSLMEEFVQREASDYQDHLNGRRIINSY